MHPLPRAKAAVGPLAFTVNSYCFGGRACFGMYETGWVRNGVLTEGVPHRPAPGPCNGTTRKLMALTTRTTSYRLARQYSAERHPGPVHGYHKVDVGARA